jgi:hypothetical protein
MPVINRIFNLSPLVVGMAVIALPVQAESSCNPVVDPVATDNSLVRTLSRIADEYEFELSIPESLDHPVRFKKSMTLERLVKHLTRDLNTVLKHKKVDDCASPVLTHLIVLPVGKEAGPVHNQQSAQEPQVDYIYIDDMESYVANVLNGSQEADLGRMTPEQREEFRIIRDALANRVEDSSQIEPTNTAGSDAGNTDPTSAETTGN